MTPDQGFICRLFHADRPFEEVEARALTQGRLIVGRSTAADWALPDAQRTLSRVHCVLTARDGRLLVEDRSTNGVFLDGDVRAPANESLALSPPQTLRLGAFLIMIEAAAPDAPAEAMAGPPAAATPATVAAASPGGSLVEAFCDGAGLDASALCGEDPVELMRRAGAIYGRTVAGLSQLMLERARLKQDHRLERTSVGAVDNNPFKWTPARKLSEDLLKSRRDGFLSEAKAVEASFEDLNRHLGATVQAAHAACEAALAALAPATIAAEAPGQGSLLKGRSAVCWEIHNRRHAQLAADQDTEGSVKQVFARTYSHVVGRSAP